MWLAVAVFSLLAYSMADIAGKGKIDNSDELGPIELLVTINSVIFVFSIILFAFGLGESGQTPWQIILTHPLIAVNQFCYVLYWLFYLLSMRFIGLSVVESFSGSTGVLFFVGLVIVNLISGKLITVRDMFHPGRLVPVILVLIFAFLLPNIEIIANKNGEELLIKAKTERKKTLVGLIFLFTALILDSCDSLITTVIMDEGDIGTVDYMMSSSFVAIISVIILVGFLWIKKHKLYIPFKNNGRYSYFYSFASLLSSILYTVASSLDAVRTGIIFIAYPIIPIIGAKIFLKEKYSWRQNLCIWMITFAAIAFCVSDSLL